MLWLIPLIRLTYFPASIFIYILIIYQITVIICLTVFQEFCIIQTSVVSTLMICINLNHHIWFSQTILPFSAFSNSKFYIIHLEWWALSIHSGISTEDVLQYAHYVYLWWKPQAGSNSQHYTNSLYTHFFLLLTRGNYNDYEEIIMFIHTYAFIMLFCDMFR